MARGGGQQQAEGQEESSVTGGNQEVLQCMLEGALRSGSLDLVRWLHARGVTWDACMLHYAAKSGNEDLVEWMAEAGYDMDQVGRPCWLQGFRAGPWEVEPCCAHAGADLDVFTRACAWLGAVLGGLCTPCCNKQNYGRHGVSRWKAVVWCLTSADRLLHGETCSL